MLTNSKGEVFEGQFQDLSGEKFNMLTVIEPVKIHRPPKGDRYLYWLVKCDCGNTAIKSASSIKSGYSKSCGCLQRIATSKARKIHGESDSRLNNTWYNMKKRCYSESNPKYKNYGARGIKVCDEWKNDYIAFSKWARENGYNDQMTIERIDVDGDYEPGNCTWIPAIEQATNRTSNLHMEIEGKEYTPQELSDLSGVPIKTIYHRISNGDEGQDLIRPLGKRRFHKRQPRGN